MALGLGVLCVLVASGWCQTSSIPSRSALPTFPASGVSVPIPSAPIRTMTWYPTQKFTRFPTQSLPVPVGLPLSGLPLSSPLFANSFSPLPASVLPSKSLLPLSLPLAPLPPAKPLSSLLPKPVPSFGGPTTAAIPTASTSSKTPKLVTSKPNMTLIEELRNPTDILLTDDSVEALFDQGSFRSWNIQLSPNDLHWMNSDPTSEKAYHCSVTSSYGSPNAKTFTSQTIGCRYKGSVGSLRMCVDENNKLNGGCRKLSISVDAAEFKKPKGEKGPKTSFHGASRLLFGGCPVDYSMMSERMSYNLLNSLNIVAPRASHAKLFLNGIYLGVYSFVQPVDEVLTQQRFSYDKDKGKGKLYKEVWLSDFHMANFTKPGKEDKDDKFMMEVLEAAKATPLTGDAPKQFWEKYFDSQAFVDVTAFNSVVGNTDDWRMRHNFFWYVRELSGGGKKLVLLPWDYDRLYDAQALTRGPLQGRPWWDIQATANIFACNAPIQSPAELARKTASTPKEIALWTDIYATLPLDNLIPITCDKITQLAAAGLGSRIRARTREFLIRIPLSNIRVWFDAWSKQITKALSRDPDGPDSVRMRSEQEKLLAHLEKARNVALQQAIDGDANPPPVFMHKPGPVTADDPMVDSPVLGAPAFGAPAFGAPAFGAPAFGAPTFGAPTFGAPAFGAPAFGAPAFGARG